MTLRGPFGLTLRHCLRRATLPTLLATVAAIALRLLTAPQVATSAAAAASPWLALPLVTAAMVCAIAAARSWPTFALERPGRQWVDRVQRGAMRGVGSAIAAALVAQLLLTAPLTVALATWLGAPREAHAPVALAAPAVAVLDARHPRLELAVPTAEPLAELALRPLVGMPDGEWLGTTFDLLADGERVAATAVPVADNRQLVRLVFAARSVRTFALVHTGGTVPLWFPPATAIALGAQRHDGLANAALLALLALLPTFVGLALGGFCGRATGLPTAIAVIAGALFVQTAAGVGGLGDALLALFRGHWLATPDVFARSAPSLAVGCGAMIAAMVLRPQVRR